MHRSIAALGVIVLVAGCATGGPPESEPGSEPPPASQAAEASAEASAPLTAGPTALEDVSEGTRLEPGTYDYHLSDVGDPDAVPSLAVTFAVPQGWERVMLDGVLWHDAGAKIGFHLVENLYTDPCASDGGPSDPVVGPTVDDLADAIAALPGWEGAGVTQTTVSGFDGQLVELAVPISGLPCDEPLFLQTRGSPGYTLAPGDEEIRIWILDVAGNRLVITARNDAGAVAMFEAAQDVINTVGIRP